MFANKEQRNETYFHVCYLTQRVELVSCWVFRTCEQLDCYGMMLMIVRKRKKGSTFAVVEVMTEMNGTSESRVGPTHITQLSFLSTALNGKAIRISFRI